VVSISQVCRVDGVPRGCAVFVALGGVQARWAALARPFGASERRSGTWSACGFDSSKRVRAARPERCRCAGRTPPASRRALDNASTRAGAAFPGPTTHDKEP
jgi:hypothetical protein